MKTSRGSSSCFERVQRKVILIIKLHRYTDVRVTTTCARANVVHSFALKIYGFVAQELDEQLVTNRARLFKRVTMN